MYGNCTISANIWSDLNSAIVSLSEVRNDKAYFLKETDVIIDNTPRVKDCAEKRAQ